MRYPWRLIVHGPLNGALNMAIDRAMQLSREDGSAPATLRLYQWARPTVTLGKFQSIDSVDLDACSDAGVDVVRRFTGGRGVLHDDELTYSVVASTADGVPRGTANSYAYLCNALATAYRHLGIQADLTHGSRGSNASGACYLQTTRADLSHGASKLSGSAQVWSGETVLQHGSFTLSRDVEREARVFMLKPAEKTALGAHAVTIDGLVENSVSVSRLTSSVISGFEDALGITLREGGLTGGEAELVSALLATTMPETPGSALRG